MVIVEQIEGLDLGDRGKRWYRSYEIPGPIYLPMDMVDSGNQALCGEFPFEVLYPRMIDGALERPARARMAVSTDRVGDLLRLDVTLTNHSRETLSVDNDATLTVLVYEQSPYSNETPRVADADITPVLYLADGATGRYTLEVPVGALDQETARWLVIADYRPVGADGGYDTLQAVTGP